MERRLPPSHTTLCAHLTLLPRCCTDRGVSQGPRRAYEKERLDVELKICGEYGLRAKKEIWRINRHLAHVRKAARVLLTLDEKDPTRLFEGAALLKRLTNYGLLADDKQKLEYVLELDVEQFLERRLQTQIWRLDMAKSIHHARVLIKQRHIRVGRQIVNVPSFMVRLESQKHIDFALTSPFGGGPPGRVKKKRLAAKGGGDEDDE